jgi:formate hydrogenlyase subunit 3/multisubunit Na+/H+ antiporter MnhD subunit
MSGNYLDLARTHAPLLLIAAPLIGAALVLVSGTARVGWILASVVGGVTAFMALDFASGVFSGAMTNFAVVAPTLYVDGVGAFAAALIALTVALIAFAVGASLKDAGAKQAPVSLALLLASAAGWIGALMARDLVAMIAAVEAAWLACVGLVLVNAVRDREPLNGALRMLSIGGVGAALMLVGAAMLGRGAGSFELDALPLASIRMTDLAGAGAALMILGLAVKAGVAPLHAWSAAAIGRANAMVTLGVGVLGVVGALCVLARFSAYVITSPYIGAAISGGAWRRLGAD